MAADRETRAMLVGKWLLAALVPASALAIGTLHTTTLIVMSLVAAAACVLLWLEPPKRITRASRLVLVAFGILFGATVIQAIPLPAGIVAAIAPGNADVWARALSPLHEPGPSWHPISVAPPATHVEILKGALYGCVFLGALRVVLSEGGSTFLSWVVVGSSSAVALTSLAHAAVQAESVFGLYRPHDAYAYPTGRLGPLLNGNHLASYVNVGAFVAAGIAVSTRTLRSRALAIGAALLLVGTAVWAASRGGTGSLVLGALVFAALAQHKRSSGSRVEIVVGVLVLVSAGVLLGLGTSEIAREDIADRDLSKFSLAKMALKLLKISPLFGFGRGAFETVFPTVHEARQYYTFLRVENIGVQWAVDWGVPAAVAGAAAFAVALRPQTVLAAARPPIGASVAVCASVVHDIVDFHLEVPGIVVLVVTCIAAVVGSRPTTSERLKNRESPSRLRMYAIATAGFAIGAGGLSLPSLGHSLSEERDAMAAAATDRGRPPSDFDHLVRGAMLRYPAEPYFPLAGAVHAQARGLSVVPWVARALERYPAFGRAHLVLARSFAARSRAQARLEYRLAYSTDLRVRESVLREVPGLVDDYDSALELVPEGREGVPMLERLCGALEARLPATTAQLDAELLRRDSGSASALRRRVLAAVSDLAHQHPWCADRQACAVAGVAPARELVARHGEMSESHVVLARVLTASGVSAASALDELSIACDRVRDRATCLRAVVQLSHELGDGARAERALDRALRGGCGTREECLDLYAWAAHIEESQGKSIRAIAFYKRAAEVAPEPDPFTVRVAELAATAGLPNEAADAYARLALRHPDQSEYRTRVDELRAKAQELRLAPPPP